MNGIQFVTDEKGRKVGVLIDLKTHGALWEDFSDGLISESRARKRAFLTENTGLRALRTGVRYTNADGCVRSPSNC